jgi:hypothetical protein
VEGVGREGGGSILRSYDLFFLTQEALGGHVTVVTI